MTDLSSTYRLQLRADAFTLADAEAILDYLDALGISHLYLSPILTATSGSTHGYDVTDPTTVSAELGGADGLAALARGAQDRGLGLIVDIVPNHVGVESPQQNPWWWDVLSHGRESAYASFFDIDWQADADGRILLPVLGSDDDVNALEVDPDTAGGVLRLGDLVFPIAPGTAGRSGTEVHDRQHYRLIGWRSGICGYRRFFSITSLAGLRQEDPEVFAASHAEVGRWFTEGLVDGLRIDHPDGLTDPAGYLARLRETVGEQAYIVIEKILAVDEALEPTLPVDGTTGYEALRDIGGLFVDPTGEEALTALAQSAGFDHTAVEAMTGELKTIAATETLASELARVSRAITAAAGATDPLLPTAVAALLTHLSVYRSDYHGLSALMSTSIAKTVAAQPQLAAALASVSTALQDPESAARIQQLCGAVTAKSVEDCLFYRDPRLVSLNEVGGEPARFGVSLAEFHHSTAQRGTLWPTAMTTLSTHDTKRGEDVRARIGVLSQVPSLWAELVGGWHRLSPCPDALTGLFLWQNIFGVWPVSGEIDDTMRERLHAYTEKAMREANLRTTWNDPDTAFESAVHDWLDALIDGPNAAELTALVGRIDQHARNDALGQKLLALTIPGVPDIYQGTELWDDSLVDPDNRRPVDYAARRAALDELTHPKIRVVQAALQLRRRRPQTFSSGSYTPVLATGSAAEHVIAFLRGTDVLVAASRWTIRLDEQGWGDTAVTLPAGTWRDCLTGATHVGQVSADALFAELPTALLERDDA